MCWYFTKHRSLAISGEGEVRRKLLSEGISVLQSRAVFHSSKDWSAVSDIDFVHYHRGNWDNFGSSHCHQVVPES